MDTTNEDKNIKRLRRHTIARPASALALLSESLSSEDEGEDYQLDRISQILSGLIQEANEAVNNKPVCSKSSNIPLVRKLTSSSSSDQLRYQKKKYRNSRPISYPNLKRSKTPSLSSITTLNNTNSYHNKTAIPVKRNSLNSIMQNQQKHTEKTLNQSFERLNSSLAIIESLSRDLAVSETNSSYDDDNDDSSTLSIESVNQPNNAEPFQTKKSLTISNQISINPRTVKKAISFDPRLSALIIIPLLHVPHILISTAFDTLSTNDDDTSSSTATTKLSGMFILAFFIAIANLMVDKTTISAPSSMSYTSETRNKHKSVHSKSGFINIENNSILPGSFIESFNPNILKTKHQKKAVSHRDYKQKFMIQHLYPNQTVQQHISYSSNTTSLPQNENRLQRRNSL